MFYLIGLGLGAPTDIPPNSLQTIKLCERVYLEAYTSILLHGGKEVLEEFYGRPICIADREQVEQGASDMLVGADKSDVALLVVGDPLGATTHTDLMLRASEMGVKVKVLHNASIMSAVGITGLSYQRFGEVVSIPFWEQTWKPDSFCQKIDKNINNGLHTLCLLDIKVKEQSLENIMKNRKIFEPPRYMRTHQAADQLLQIIAGKEVDSLSLSQDTLCVACVRLGTAEQSNRLMSLKEMADTDLGAPLHSMVICAPLTPEERSYCTAMSHPCPAKDSGRGTLYLVGLGMGCQDVTLRGREVINTCSKRFFDRRSFSILKTTGDDRSVSKLLDSEYEMFDLAQSEDVLSMLREGISVSVCVWGDPLVFTEYQALLALATSNGTPFEVVHNTSIVSCIGSCGLQLYTFGGTVSFPPIASIFDNNALLSKIGEKDSFFEKLLVNRRNGWHTLCLLHAVPNSLNFSAVGYSCQAAAKLLLKAIGLCPSAHLKGSDKVIAVSGIGSSDSNFKLSTLEELAEAPPVDGGVHALIIPGAMHPLEQDCLTLLSKSMQAFVSRSLYRNTIMSKRGALIVLEGCDRVGKSTQSKLIVESLTKDGIPAKLMNFPDRSTTIGKQIDMYLRCKEELDDRSIHLLFSANRWEMASKMEKLLLEGTSLVVDRYAYSGVAFTAAKGLPLKWCQSPDAGLLRPDLVLYLTLEAKQAKERGGYGEERYEKEEMQAKVRHIYTKLLQEEWKVIAADGKSIEEMQAELLGLVRQAVASCSGKPLTKLWKELQE